MASLKDRLKRIQTHTPRLDYQSKTCSASAERKSAADSVFEGSGAELGDFTECGFNTMRRRKIIPLPAALSLPLSKGSLLHIANLPIVIPDFSKALPREGSPLSEDGFMPLDDLVFFDLETTGLSGGAGTIAFLAAFGVFIERCPQDAVCVEPCPQDGGFIPDSSQTKIGAIQIDQYLLLDFSGEIDFLEHALTHFAPRQDSAMQAMLNPKVVATYNGKSFDRQIFASRCLINGMDPPAYRIADLLHPARRLWKRVLANCSQSEIEKTILGIQRDDDIPGSMAPDIWFEFLRTRSHENASPSRVAAARAALLGICDHNVSDIAGLAGIFCALHDIARDPLENGKKYACDAEALALLWHKHKPKRGEGAGAPVSPLPSAASRLSDTPLSWGLCPQTPTTADQLLKNAAEQTNPVCPVANRILAVESEWQAKDYKAALFHVNNALQAAALGETLLQDLKRRKTRLEKKLERL